MPNFKFYFTAMGQAGSPKNDFLIDCYRTLTASVKAERILKKVGSNFGDFRIDFLGECEAICETASARE
jgi:hypothetical protein